MNETQYVSEINGYKIKDSEARDNISNLQSENMDLVNIKNITTSDLTGDTNIIDEIYNGAIAWNNNSKWFKYFIYFKITVTSEVNDRVIDLPLPTGFTVTTSYNIANVVQIYNEDQLFYGVDGLQISSQHIRIVIPANLNGTFYYSAMPFLYYNGKIEN